MQDRYVADVGDFAKYALLRRLTARQGEHQLRLGFVWCLFPNESHNNDGRHISYLQKMEFQGLDDSLLAALGKILASGNRSIRSISGGGLFPAGTVFYEAIASAPPASRLSRSDRLQHRSDWLDRSLDATERCEFVFFDPDNGLEIASVPKHHPNGGKYIYWDELIPFWRRGQALLIYHHLNRTKPAAHQVSGLRRRFLSQFYEASVLPLVFRRGSCRVFWLVYPNSATGSELERRASEFLASGWSKHFRSTDWPGENDVASFSVV